MLATIFTASTRAIALALAEKNRTCETWDAGDGWTGVATWNARRGKVLTHLLNPQGMMIL